MSVFVACDPAFSQSKQADLSAIVTVGVDQTNSWWVLETAHGRWRVDELIAAYMQYRITEPRMLVPIVPKSWQARAASQLLAQQQHTHNVGTQVAAVAARMVRLVPSLPQSTVGRELRAIHCDLLEIIDIMHSVPR